MTYNGLHPEAPAAMRASSLYHLHCDTVHKANMQVRRCGEFTKEQQLVLAIFLKALNRARDEAEVRAWA